MHQEARSAEGATGTQKTFDTRFRESLSELLAWRRDVRRFRSDPVDDELLRELLALAILSPSVGNSQPWRFVQVTSPDRREAIAESFRRCNADALAAYAGERAQAYARLKLAGLGEAPTQIAVFCDQETGAGHGLGRRTMPETLRFSVVMAIHTFWLAARAHGLGAGWISILDPVEVRAALDVPDAWTLIAYLCVGYPAEEHTDPELVRHGWQARLPLDDVLLQR